VLRSLDGGTTGEVLYERLTLKHPLEVRVFSYGPDTQEAQCKGHCTSIINPYKTFVKPIYNSIYK